MEERETVFEEPAAGAPQETGPETPAAADTEPGGDAPIATDEDAYALEAQARRLITQAETIRDLTGADVFQRYLTDAEAHRRVLSGEWDFRNVLESMAGERNAPPVVRSANGGSAGIRVKSMSESQFRRFDEALEKGEIIDMRM